MGRPWASRESIVLIMKIAWRQFWIIGTVLVCVPQLKRKVRDISFMTQHNSGQ
jgi:hypothetical protein